MLNFNDLAYASIATRIATNAVPPDVQAALRKLVSALPTEAGNLLMNEAHMGAIDNVLSESLGRTHKDNWSAQEWVQLFLHRHGYRDPDVNAGATAIVMDRMERIKNGTIKILDAQAMSDYIIAKVAASLR